MRTIPSVLEAASQSQDDALVDGSVRWTFAQLADEVRRWSASVMASGVRPGDRVAVWAPNSWRFVVAALGAVTAGAVLVPINTRYKGGEARWILDKSGAGLLFVEDGFLDNDYLAMLGNAGDLDIVRLDGDGPAAFRERGNYVDPADVKARAEAIGEDDPSDMFFTSGTTGRPKGAITTHGQNVRVYEAWGGGVGLQRGDRYLVVNPMFHTFGYKAGVLACLIRQATLISQPVFDVAESLRLIAEERVTILPGPPTLYVSILDHPARADAELSSLRIAVTGASVVPVALVERMRAELFPQVIIAYGMTETCGTATVGDPNDDAETIATTVGRPIPGTEVEVADTGEVLVRGYNVMQGYFDDDDATAAAIDSDGWLHTGDVGELRADGNLRITDRLKDMFVVGGFNVYPAEVEQTIARHDKVSEAAVIGVADARMGEVGRAYVIPRPDAEVTESEIIEYCRERLANFKVPRSVRVVDSLPRNASGKVLKYELRAQTP
ncbi:MAG TPA: FadD3 family acyl-CoA ligase [Jatrophihabitantaceae bacterium]|nr:FadD3 family acyl-CoA ligase [Jatrophihabitantaceae bacterium]